jgi:hypothetical protein
MPRLLPLLALLPAAPAFAAPLSYSEALQGDLVHARTPGALQVLSLDAGTNRVAGRVTAPGFYTFGYDADSFAFDVPIGMELVGLVLEMTPVSGQQGGIVWRLARDSAQQGGGSVAAHLTVYTPGQASYTGAPLGAGTHNLSFYSAAAWFGSADWSFTLDVQRIAAVPEPGGLALSVLALSLLGAGTRPRPGRANPGPACRGYSPRAA